MPDHISRKTERFIKQRTCRIVMTNQLTTLVVISRIRAAIEKALNAVLIFKNLGGPEQRVVPDASHNAPSVPDHQRLPGLPR
ncbi:hypothetical protein [Pseudomonas syringae]|uniref:hypothetical protein n=1 Tax=Pseudomonas syringae TaxID=317 RepID=UPI001EFD263A|nr:hypothetical protein [Pseudomonas syringae]